MLDLTEKVSACCVEYMGCNSSEDRAGDAQLVDQRKSYDDYVNLSLGARQVDTIDRSVCIDWL